MAIIFGLTAVHERDCSSFGAHFAETGRSSNSFKWSPTELMDAGKENQKKVLSFGAQSWCCCAETSF
jgi:hypothetical protein